MKRRRPAAALGSDGEIYVHVAELLDEETSGKAYRRVAEVVAGEVFIAVRLQRLVTSGSMKRLDDAVAEIVATRKR